MNATKKFVNIIAPIYEIQHNAVLLNSNRTNRCFDPIRSSHKEFIEHHRDFLKEANNNCSTHEWNRTGVPVALRYPRSEERERKKQRRRSANKTTEGKKKREKGGEVGGPEAAMVNDEEREKEGKK